MLEVRPKTVRFVHEMFRGDGGDHLATMMVTGVHIDIVARKSTQFEPQIFSKSQAMVAQRSGALGRVAAGAGLPRLARAIKKGRGDCVIHRGLSSAADWLVRLETHQYFQRTPSAN